MPHQSVVTVTTFTAYRDERGNQIRFTLPDVIPALPEEFQVVFRGSNNVLEIDSTARLKKLVVRFDAHDAACRLGGNTDTAAFSGIIRLGADSAVTLGDNVSTTHPVDISAVEGAKVSIGRDVMIAARVMVRSDDGHPIFDVHTGERVNPAQDIQVGDHVWMGLGSVILGGSVIGSGSVVGTMSLVTKRFPNNVTIGGSPAQILRKDIAWERPHLSLIEPYYKPDSSTIHTSMYWRPTALFSVGTRPAPSGTPRPRGLKKFTQWLKKNVVDRVFHRYF